ncbi:hypothetical protein U9M48_033816 [Paspalum notatum var. saurae]|uniref:Uncharacterized protein n=1 Tax=Paspalum notatum var. saurae TaxID=547442 RepID=A0AAQ3U965_PASNO
MHVFIPSTTTDGSSSPALFDDGSEERRRDHRSEVPGLRARQLDAATLGFGGRRLRRGRPHLAAREAAAVRLHLPLRDVARLGHLLAHVGVSGEHGDHLRHGRPFVGCALGAVERHADHTQDLLVIVLRQLGVHEVEGPTVLVQFPHLKRCDNVDGKGPLKSLLSMYLHLKGYNVRGIAGVKP